MEDLKNKTLEELRGISKEQGLSAFKVREIFRQIHQKVKTDFSEFTTLKKDEREKLGSKYYISGFKVRKIEKSQGVKKVSFELEDGLVIEAVYMNYGEDRSTVCVSSQVGCPVGCSFCATGGMGFKRNLTVSEILSQIYYFAREEKISNIVFMGMGEPFLNFEKTVNAAKILNNELGLNIAARKIVFSTIGIIAGIEKFTEVDRQFRLAWSLPAPFDDLRRTLVGWKSLPSIDETILALLEYQKKTKRRITIEYVLLKDLNDGDRELRELAKIAHKIDSHVNLIPYNPSLDIPLQGGNIEKAYALLKKLKINVTIRKSLGQNISAACGQLCVKV